MVTVTDGERTVRIPCTQLGQITCPRCRAVCTWSLTTKLFECPRCGRGWNKLPELAEVRNGFVQNADGSIGRVIDESQDGCDWKVLVGHRYVWWQKGLCISWYE